MLNSDQYWRRGTTEEVRKMLKKMCMHYSKPYQHHYLKPRNAEDILKKLR
jgi:hypothetical protein